MNYHMRRMDRAIKDRKTMEKVLKEARYVTLALSKDNSPYLVSLSSFYDHDAECIYFHCAQEGRKLDYMRANPSVWGQAILDRGYLDGECNHLYATVMFEGKVEFANSVAEKRRIMEFMFEQQAARGPKRAGVDPHKARISNDAELSQTMVGKIVLSELTGKISKGFEF